jgi:site-specific recombinase XerD
MTDNLKDLHLCQEKFIGFLKKQGKASATILAYGNDIKQFVDYLTKEKKITQATSVLPEHIEDFKKYLAEKKYIAKSISRKLNSIKTFFRFLLSRGTIKNDPASIVAHPRYEPVPPRILSKIEYRALRDCARDDPRSAAIVEVLLQTGMRVGELARLTLDDISDKEIKIAPYESNPGRVVPLNSAAKKALQRWLDFRPQTTSKNLFITKNGKPLPVRNIRALFNRLFKKAGIENATINSLRHTFVAHQLMAGAPLELVQKIVGHKRLSTTEKYLELIKTHPPSLSKLEEL